MKTYLRVQCLLQWFSYLCTLCLVLNKLTPTQFLKDPEFLLSNNGDFKLGFFSPPNTTNRYVGIWFNKVTVNDIIWVANRNNPLSNPTGILKIAEDGHLQVVDRTKHTFWSSNVSNPNVKIDKVSLSAQLSDTGNLILSHFDPNDESSTANETILWQSFDSPVNTILPTANYRLTISNMKRAWLPWKSATDPAYGTFSAGADSLSHPQIMVWDGDRPYWRTGPWNGNIFLGLIYTDEATNYANTFVRTNEDGTFNFVYTGASTLKFSHYEFGYDGSMNEKWWDGEKGKWEYVWRIPDNKCDLYGYCGRYGVCNTRRSPMCRCLKGFVPKNSEEWRRGNWSSGCARKKKLKCGIEGEKEDGFLALRKVKLPDHVEWSAGVNQVHCRSQCLRNCSCVAYAYDTGAGCMHWSRDLIDIQEFSTGGVDLYLHLPKSELGNDGAQIIIIAITVGIGATAIATLVYLLWGRIRRKKDKAQRKKQLIQELKNMGSNHHVQVEDLPLFKFETLVMATSAFQEKNKLGQGGFGPVYKGKLEDGREIAVKRLSAASGQGLEEFMNEVVVISKLQHRNLVKLLGCCVEKDDKMLIYEYMPNRSLDSILFDPLKHKNLNWDERFNIIEGICRGIVYLHRDSRLRIIHRDLKASNILLDEDLNPKISDFGMARIFSYKQDEGCTKRVVGTYGYMSPEYAMEGHFSEKSDVYSFGVLLLEIVTGKKNSSFWIDEQSLTLLGYVWKSWKSNSTSSTVDPAICDPSIQPHVLRCIKVGLLCVQEYTGDRPNISSVLSMLINFDINVANLPSPKQPGFCRRLMSAETVTDYSQQRLRSNIDANTSLDTRSNAFTITRLVPR